MYVLNVLRPHHEEVGKEACKRVGICAKGVVHRLNGFFEAVKFYSISSCLSNTSFLRKSVALS